MYFTDFEKIIFSRSKKTYAELLEFCEEALRIAKPFALPPNSLVERISGLYLLYGLFSKMPVDNVKIRVTQKEWSQFLDLYSQLKNNEYLDATYIFVRLVYNHAFLHTLFEVEVSSHILVTGFWRYFPFLFYKKKQLFFIFKNDQQVFEKKLFSKFRNVLSKTEIGK